MMEKQNIEINLITHNLVEQNLSNAVFAIRHKIINTGDTSETTVTEQLNILDQLTQFGFGQCLITNRGITGSWTRHMVLYPKWRKEMPEVAASLTPLNRWLLEKCPVILATQERFIYFQKLLHENLKEGMTAMSIPCGLMDDLLTLNLCYLPSIKLIGIDLDEASILGAKETAKKYNLEKLCNFIKLDAWQLTLQNEANIITSNGLNFYQHDEEKVVELYRRIFLALKPKGVFITSFLTPPPSISDESPWDMNKINLADLRMQKIIMSDILSVRFQAYRTEKQTIQQLTAAGFDNIKLLYDKAKLFPTIWCFK